MEDNNENENQNELNLEELDLLAFILNQQERPLYSGLQMGQAYSLLRSTRMI